ncbi:MAG: hypothetical protein ABI833_12710 [Acidobacteriota bacterium]
MGYSLSRFVAGFSHSTATPQPFIEERLGLLEVRISLIERGDKHV